MCFVCGTWSSPRWCMSESLTICTPFCVKHAVVRGSTSPTASAPSINCSIVPRAIAERCSTSVSKLLHSPTGNNRTLLYIGLDVRHLCGAAEREQRRSDGEGRESAPHRVCAAVPPAALWALSRALPTATVVWSRQLTANMLLVLDVPSTGSMVGRARARSLSPQLRRSRRLLNSLKGRAR